MSDNSSPFAELNSRRRGGIPPSRVGARSDQVIIPTTTVKTPDVVADTPAKPTTKPTKKASSDGAVPDELVKTTVHLGQAEDEFLNLVNFTGKQVRPKFDASRSAVVRLALRRLADELNPAEVVAALAERGPETARTGRRRLG